MGIRRTPRGERDMGKSIIFVHGRDFKPHRDVLLKLWTDALWSGIDRDFGGVEGIAHAAGSGPPSRRPAEIQMAYYGDKSLEFLSRRGNTYDEAEDVEDRQRALRDLKDLRKDDFLGRRGKQRYEDLKGSSGVAETIADVITGPLAFVGLGEQAVKLVAPDLVHYWNPDMEFGSDVRWSLTRPLREAVLAGDDILLIGHSLGAVVAYDVLWKFSHYAEYRHTLPQHSISLLTIGSPLADETTKQNLKGSRAQGLRRYPWNVSRWWNVAAEGDFISHDQSVSNDYHGMEAAPLEVAIQDHRIYNVAERKGTSNPHHSLGYLIHPTVTSIVAAWLQSS